VPLILLFQLVAIIPLCLSILFQFFRRRRSCISLGTWPLLRRLGVWDRTQARLATLAAYMRISVVFRATSATILADRWRVIANE
jgi:hypothetical protein